MFVKAALNKALSSASSRTTGGFRRDAPAPMLSVLLQHGGAQRCSRARRPVSLTRVDGLRVRGQPRRAFTERSLAPKKIDQAQRFGPRTFKRRPR